MAFRRGYRAELELVEALRKQGFYAARIPISGGRSVPCDVMAARGDDRRAYQVKETRSKRIYIDEEEVKGLLGFCKAFGLRALIAVKWKGRRGAWTVVEVKEI